MSKRYDSPCKGGDDCFDEGHLCKIVKQQNHEQIRQIVKDAEYFCRKCGRAAQKEIYLCKPLKI
jgi:hypothetical protein